MPAQQSDRENKFYFSSPLFSIQSFKGWDDAHPFWRETLTLLSPLIQMLETTSQIYLKCLIWALHDPAKLTQKINYHICQAPAIRKTNFRVYQLMGKASYLEISQYLLNYLLAEGPLANCSHSLTLHFCLCKMRIMIFILQSDNWD